MAHDLHVMRLAVKAYLSDVKAKIHALRDMEERTEAVRESMEGVRSPAIEAIRASKSDKMTNGLIMLQTLEE